MPIDIGYILSEYGAELQRLVFRHLAGLVWMDQSRKRVAHAKTLRDRYDIQCFLISGFLLETRGVWHFATAGHVLTAIRDRLKHGRHIIKASLQDGWHTDNTRDRLVPYVLDLNEMILRAVRVDTDTGLDYGLLPIHRHCVQLMNAIGTEPVPEAGWGSDRARYDFLLLAGFPREIVQITSDSSANAGNFHIRSGTPLLPMERVPSRLAPTILRKQHGRVFGRIVSMDGRRDGKPIALKSIGGMSGGPVFGIRVRKKSICYRLLGIQSAWHAPTRTIAACPIVPFGDAIGSRLDELFAAHPDLLADHGDE